MGYDTRPEMTHHITQDVASCGTPRAFLAEVIQQEWPEEFRMEIAYDIAPEVFCDKIIQAETYRFSIHSRMKGNGTAVIDNLLTYITKKVQINPLCTIHSVLN